MIDQKGIEIGWFIIQKVRNSPNPDRATDIVLEVLERISAGEDLNSIKASYGADWDKYIFHSQ